MFIEKNESFIYEFGKMLDESLKTEVFEKFLIEEKIAVEFELYNLDEFRIMIDFTDSTGTKVIEQLYSQISFYNNIILFCTDYGSINLLICIGDK